MLWEKSMSWRLVRLFQSSFNFLANLKSELGKHFTLLLGLAHSSFFQIYPVTNPDLGPCAGSSATQVGFSFTVKSSFHVFCKLTYTTLLTLQQHWK